MGKMFSVAAKGGAHSSHIGIGMSREPYLEGLKLPTQAVMVGGAEHKGVERPNVSVFHGVRRGAPGVRDRYAVFTGPCGRLFNHKVAVGAPKAERTHTGKARHVFGPVRTLDA